MTTEQQTFSFELIIQQDISVSFFIQKKRNLYYSSKKKGQNMEDQPPAMFIWNHAPWIGSNEHTHEDNTSNKALLMRRDTPSGFKSRPNKGKQHHLHGFGNPSHACVRKHKNMEISKPHGHKSLVHSVCFAAIFRWHLSKAWEEE